MACRVGTLMCTMHPPRDDAQKLPRQLQAEGKMETSGLYCRIRRPSIALKSAQKEGTHQYHQRRGTGILVASEANSI